MFAWCRRRISKSVSSPTTTVLAVLEDWSSLDDKHVSITSGMSCCTSSFLKVGTKNGEEALLVALLLRKSFFFRVTTVWWVNATVGPLRL